MVKDRGDSSTSSWLDWIFGGRMFGNQGSANRSSSSREAPVDDAASAVMANDFKLTVQVSGSASVSGPLGIGLTFGADCEVHMDATAVLDPATSHQVIESKQCNYKYIM